MDNSLDELAQSARLATENGAIGPMPTTQMRPQPVIAPEDDPRTLLAMQRMHNAAILPAAIRAAGRKSTNVEDMRREHGPDTGT